MVTYLLSELISENILKYDQNSFIQEQGLWKDYNSMPNKKFSLFIQESIMKGNISRSDFSNFLFDKLFFGQQRETYMFNLYKFTDELKDENKLLKRIQKEYSYITDLNYNKLMYKSDEFERQDLIAIKIIHQRKINAISKVRLIFGQNVKISKNKMPRKTISYIAIEVDIINKRLYIKVAPKHNIISKNQKPDKISYDYYKLVAKMFEIIIIPFNNTHKEITCRMSKDLYHQVYNQMVTNKPKELPKFIEDTSNHLIEILNIQNLDYKKIDNNIFNIKDNYNKMIENILISDILYSIKEGSDLYNVDGFVTYLKFNDGKNISARLKGQDCRDPIFDSESFMALRSAIENSKRINRLEINWFDKYDGLRVTYDSNSLEFLNIHFYSNITEEKFYYGLEKYIEYERKNKHPIIRLSAMEA